MVEISSVTSNLSKTPEELNAAAQEMLLALRNPMVPKLYTNHYGVVRGVHDVSLVLSQNGGPAGIVLMSYPLAKSLAKAMTEAIEGYEKSVQQTIPDVAMLEEALKKG